MKKIRLKHGSHIIKICFGCPVSIFNNRESGISCAIAGRKMTYKEGIGEIPEWCTLEDHEEPPCICGGSGHYEDPHHSAPMICREHYKGEGNGQSKP